MSATSGSRNFVTRFATARAGPYRPSTASTTVAPTVTPTDARGQHPCRIPSPPPGLTSTTVLGRLAGVLVGSGGGADRRTNRLVPGNAGATRYEPSFCTRRQSQSNGASIRSALPDYGYASFESAGGSAVSSGSQEGGSGAQAHAHRPSGHPVRDRDEAIAFYTETLGFSLVVDTPFGDGKRWVEVAPPRGGATVALTESAEILDRGRLTGIVLRSADPRADHATLQVSFFETQPQPPDGHRGPVGDALSTPKWNAPTTAGRLDFGTQRHRLDNSVPMDRTTWHDRCPVVRGLVQR